MQCGQCGRRGRRPRGAQQIYFRQDVTRRDVEHNRGQRTRPNANVGRHWQRSSRGGGFREGLEQVGKSSTCLVAASNHTVMLALHRFREGKLGVERIQDRIGVGGCFTAGPGWMLTVVVVGGTALGGAPAESSPADCLGIRPLVGKVEHGATVISGSQGPNFFVRRKGKGQMQEPGVPTLADERTRGTGRARFTAAGGERMRTRKARRAGG